MVGLTDAEIHLVQDQWQGKKELQATNYMVRGSAKDLHYFQIVPPLESPKIMGLKGIHSPRLSSIKPVSCSASGVGKEGQNEGSIVNNLCTWALPHWAGL